MTRYVFVTGGVVSSLGKGIAAASLAAVLEARGLKVTLLKLDPTGCIYINMYVCSTFGDFNERNLTTTSKLLQQGYRFQN